MTQQQPGLQELMKMLSGATPEATRQLEVRARRGQFTFAATTFAARSGCSCEGCIFLRKAVDMELAEAREEAGIDAQGNYPVTRQDPVFPGAKSPGDEGGSDLPG